MFTTARAFIKSFGRKPPPDVELVKLRSINFALNEDESNMEAVFAGEAVKLFANQCVKWFKSSPGQNFVQVSMTDRESGQEYTLTMQRVGGIKAPVVS